MNASSKIDRPLTSNGLLLFREEINQFIESKKKEEVDYKTISSYATNLNKFQNFLFNKKLKEKNDVTEEDLFDYIENLQQNGFGLKSLNQHIATLRGFFSYYALNNKKENLAINLHHFKVRENKDDVIDTTVVEDFLSHLESSDQIVLRDRLILLFIIKFGINGSNICELKNSNVLFKDNVFHIIIPNDKSIAVDQNQIPIYTLLTNYFHLRATINTKQDNFFLTSNNNPLTRPHIIYCLKMACKKFGMEELSLVTLTKASTPLSEEIKRETIINDRYIIQKLIEKISDVSLYLVKDNQDNDKNKLLRFYQRDAGNIDDIGNRLKALSHPFISRIENFGCLNKPSGFFVVEELISSNPIDNYAGTLSAKQIKALFLDLLSALSCIHKENLFHLNINPKSIHIVQRGRSIAPLFTNFNLINQPDPASKQLDLYDLGLVMHRLMGGTSENANHLFTEQQKYPEYLTNIVLRMIDPDINNRYKNIEQIESALRDTLHVGQGGLNRVFIPHPIPLELIDKANELIDKLQNGTTNISPSIVTIRGEKESGLSLFINEIISTLNLKSIHCITIDCIQNAPSILLHDLLNFDKDDKRHEGGEFLLNNFDIEYNRNKISTLETLFNSIFLRTPLAIFFSNLNLATIDFIESIVYLIRRITTTNSNILILFSFENGSAKYIDAVEHLESTIKQISHISITIEPFTQVSLKDYLNLIFGAKISDEFLDYLFVKSNGMRGKIYHLLKEISKNEALLLNSKGYVEYNSEFHHKSRSTVDDYFNYKEKYLFDVLACINQPTSLNFLKEVVSEYNKDSSDIMQNIFLQLSQNNFVEAFTFNLKKLIKFPELFELNNYYNKIDFAEKRRIHTLIAEQIESYGSNNSSSALSILNHYQRADNKTKTFYYFMALSEQSLMLGFFSDGLNFCKKAYALLDSVGKKDRFYVTLLYAKLLSDNSRFSSVLKKYSRAEELISDTDDKLLFIIYKSKILIKSGDIENALNLIEDGILIANRAGKSEIELNLAILACTTLILQSRFKSADEIIKNYKTSKFAKLFPIKILELYNLAGLSHYYQSNLSEAISILSDVAIRANKLGSIRIETTATYTIGLVYYRQVEYKKTVSYYNRVLKLLDENNDILGKVTTINALAILNHKIGKFNSALNLYYEGLKLYKTIGQSLGYEDLLIGLSTIFLNLGNIEEATKYFKEANELISRKKNQRLIAYSYLLHANITKRQGLLTESMESFNQAITIFKKIDLEKEYYLSLLNKIELLIVTSQIEKATHEFNKISENSLINFSDIHLKYILEKIRLQISTDFKDTKCINEEFRIIEKNPLFTQDWEVFLSFHSLKILFYDKYNQKERIDGEFYALKHKLEKLSETLPSNLSELFIEMNEFTLPLTYLTSIEEEDGGFISSIFDLSNTLNLNILVLKSLRYFIQLTGVERGFVIFMQDKTTEVRESKNKNGINIEKELPNFYKSIINEIASDRGGVKFKTIKIDNSEIKTVIAVSSNSEDVVIFCGDFSGAINNSDAHTVKHLKYFIDQFSICLKNVNRYSELQNEVKILREKNEAYEKENELIKKSIEQNEQRLEFAERQMSIKERSENALYENIIGRSAKMKELITLIDRSAASDISVLITGESGTGKELIARAIHKASVRRNNNFIAENCAALSENLLESELFGHMKGSYTDATSDRPGIFEIADGGTVFLDEIGDTTLNLQKRLLRVLQEGEVRRIGDRKTRKVNVRVISATNKILTDMIANGSFREDLYYRLNVFSVVLPPLRERREDIEDLVYYFLKKYGPKDKKTEIDIDYEIIESFKKYNWPGNIRELENEIKRLLVLSDGKHLTKKLLFNDPRFG